MCRERKRGGRKSRNGVTQHGERLAMFQAVREVSSGKFRQAGEAISDSFDHAEPRRSSSDRRKKGGQNSRGSFVAPVAEEAGKTYAENGAIEPRTMLRAFGHGGGVYRQELPTS